MSDRREPLDAEERALAAALPRLHGRSAPDAAMDARILAAAHAAAPAARRRRWVLPLGAAASLVLALGLAWRLRPLPPPMAAQAPMSHQASQASEYAAPPAAAAPLRAPAASPAAPPPDRAARAATPAAGSGTSAAAPAPAAQADAPTENAPSPPPPAPPAPPAAPAPATALPASSQAQESSPYGTAPPAARTRSGERESLDSITVTGSRIRNEADMAADAHAAGEPEEDVPPATADSPEVREAWLRRITDLLREGREDEARASLQEFRRRYPDAPLPPELRSLPP